MRNHIDERKLKVSAINLAFYILHKASSADAQRRGCLSDWNIVESQIEDAKTYKFSFTR